ncbi:MAG: hypothetical protein PWR06_696 [Thermoanaerobacteraceae bacterium]|uniref:UPF0316 protein D2962_03770 n=1 Tax=Biomaibacter acetigenes TaxID=2316383 RepID=A0A3G2R3E3_9FIRM|nr:DUF2179 domain-containing protein [Biomaibacter acetigenes]MDK2877980.1 hypothetical protein [Thermoanaerobacteraceae bacterium]
MLSLLAGYLFIFCARVVDVSLATIRTLMIVRGNRLQAAMIGFFEVIVYITALNRVVGGLNNPANLMAYALGFATGNYVGSFIEEKLAIGLITVQIITRNPAVVENIRQKGFGVTVLEGMGKEGSRQVLMVSLSRKALPFLLDLVEQEDQAAFVTVMDTKVTRGGYFKQTMKAK